MKYRSMYHYFYSRMNCWMWIFSIMEINMFDN